VLTRKQLKALTENRGYKEFIQACLSTSTVLFLGITADDFAVGGHLESLKNLAPDSGTHYWLTDRADAKTDAWAESNQIRVIRYQNTSGNHGEVVDFLSDVTEYVPRDDIPPPVVSEKTLSADEEIPTPAELMRMDADKIRTILNAHSLKILSEGDNSAYEKFDQFCATYDEAIYRAWYTSDVPPQNKLLGYELNEVIGKGAFGTVYKSTDPSGKIVAIKILNQEVRRVGEMLQSFRRGVRSMNILGAASVPGMVRFIDASEIPAFVVMDWIDGINLREAVEAHQITEWNDRLKIAYSLANIIHGAHRLPERVLHRDLRPPNIMLHNFYTEPSAWEVIVLDFDLSWHVGAAEKSILIGAHTTGYLAPEQLQDNPKVSTRHSSVDAFGIGMTLYYLVSGADPFPTSHRHADWVQTVRNAVCAHKCSEWKSLPDRYARVIISSTKDKQSERWDLGQILSEVDRLNSALNNFESIDSSELIAEELMARLSRSSGYSWDEDELIATINLPSGLYLSTEGDEVKSVIKLKVAWSSTDQHDRRRVIKWLDGVGNSVEEKLKSEGWNVDPHTTWHREIRFSASIRNDLVISNFDHVVNVVDDIVRKLSFS